MEKAKKHHVEILLPTDYVTASAFSKDAEVGYATDAEGIPDEWLGLDCGEKSINAFNETIKKSKTILWNGPAGVFEFPNFAKGSISMLNAAIGAAKSGSTVIVGGGDTATCMAFPFLYANRYSGCKEWKRE
jgi:phosphoglycerate kinase